MVTTDRGLAGSLNANATRSVLRWVAVTEVMEGGESIVGRASAFLPLHENLEICRAYLTRAHPSVFFSHVNDAGFWLVKEYFNVSVAENIKTWSIMETLIRILSYGRYLLSSLSALSFGILSQ